MPVDRVAIRHVEWGEPVDRWCERCALTSRVEAVLHALLPTGLLVLGVWSYCDCDERGGWWGCALCNRIMVWGATVPHRHLLDVHHVGG